MIGVSKDAGRHQMIKSITQLLRCHACGRIFETKKNVNKEKTKKNQEKYWEKEEKGSRRKRQRGALAAAAEERREELSFTKELGEAKISILAINFMFCVFSWGILNGIENNLLHLLQSFLQMTCISL